MESAYEIGHDCLCVLFRPGVDCDELVEVREPEGKRGLYWAGLYLSYN